MAYQICAFCIMLIMSSGSALALSPPSPKIDILQDWGTPAFTLSEETLHIPSEFFIHRQDFVEYDFNRNPSPHSISIYVAYPKAASAKTALTDFIARNRSETTPIQFIEEYEDSLLTVEAFKSISADELLRRKNRYSEAEKVLFSENKRIRETSHKDFAGPLPPTPSRFRHAPLIHGYFLEGIQIPAVNIEIIDKKAFETHCAQPSDKPYSAVIKTYCYERKSLFTHMPDWLASSKAHEQPPISAADMMLMDETVVKITGNIYLRYVLPPHLEPNTEFRQHISRLIQQFITP